MADLAMTAELDRLASDWVALRPLADCAQKHGCTAAEALRRWHVLRASKSTNKGE